MAAFSSFPSDESPFFFIKATDEKRTEVDIPKLVVDELQADRAASERRGNKHRRAFPADATIAIDASHFIAFGILDGS